MTVPITNSTAITTPGKLAYRKAETDSVTGAALRKVERRTKIRDPFGRGSRFLNDEDSDDASVEFSYSVYTLECLREMLVLHDVELRSARQIQ